jgi:hypothetical protein
VSPSKNGTRRAFLLAGAAVPLVRGATRKRPILDAHLHCPSAAGPVIQWHRVTHNFEDTGYSRPTCIIGQYESKRN